MNNQVIGWDDNVPVDETMRDVSQEWMVNVNRLTVIVRRL